MSEFTLEYWEDDGWLVGRLREIPGVFSQGADIKELTVNIKDAYRLMQASDNMDQLPPKRNTIPLEISV